MKIEKLLNEIALLRMLCGKRIRGQVLVFYALMMPIFLLCGGVALDLGWYYLNVSRLQNAADAAALAGARVIMNNSDETFGIHYYTKTLTKAVPEKIELGVIDYEKIDKEKIKPTGSEKYKTSDEVKEKVKATMIAGRDKAEKYTRDNLSDKTAVQSPSTSTQKISALDAYSTAVKEEGKKVDGHVNLFIERTDYRSDVYGPMYYRVVLIEQVSHFFLRNFDPMEAIVASVVLLEPHDTDLLSAMRILEDTKVIKNWEIQNYGYSKGNAPYTEKWNHFQRASKKIYYTDGDVFRTENFEVNAQTGGKGTARTTSANGGKIIQDNELDSINIDYKQDLKMGSTGFTKDWDLGVEELPVKSITGVSSSYSGAGWDSNKAFDLRIHSYVDFNAPWPTRYPESSKPDILWCRIESDPYFWNLGDIGKTMTELNSVRQIFLNFNKSNAGRYPENSTEGVPGAYKYRPLCIFYMGPEKLEKDDDTKRVSQPLVLNFNTDYNAIIFAPNSPVVINGNGHTFKGFVIAKEFVKAKEESDYKKFESKEAYFELEDLNFMLKSDTLPENATGVSLDYIKDDVKYYIANSDEVKAIANTSTVPDDKVQVTFSGSDSQYKYYVDVGNLKCVSKDENIPEGAVEIDLSDKSKLTGYINEEDHFYKRVEESSIGCLDRAAGLDYDEATHGNEKHKNEFFVDWKGNLQTKPMEESSYREKNDDEEIDDEALIQNQSVEVVYNREAFGFSNDSYYSSFEEETLDRKIYDYLDSGNSVDMFFTTERASWVD